MKNHIMGLFLLILPLGLTFVVGYGNLAIDWEDFATVDINLFTFQWVTIYHIVWFICGVLALTFYAYNIFFNKSCLSIFGIPIQIGAFVLAWVLWMVFNGPLDHFDTLEIEDTTYHLIQTSANATGLLYLFTCEEHICEIERIGYVDSSKFFDADMTYDETSHTIYVTADLGFDIEEILIPLDDGD